MASSLVLPACLHCRVGDRLVRDNLGHPTVSIGSRVADGCEAQLPLRMPAFSLDNGSTKILICDV